MENSNIKTILYVAIALITLIGATWGAGEYLHSFIRRPEFTVRLNKIQKQVDHLEDRIIDLMRER